MTQYRFRLETGKIFPVKALISTKESELLSMQQHSLSNTVMRMKPVLIALLSCSFLYAGAQTRLITNVQARNSTSLNGQWQYIVDPYETGYYDYRWQERRSGDREAYWNSDVPDNKSDRKEHGYTDKYAIRVPGDWNSQDAKFLYYEGTVWYNRNFDFNKTNPSSKVFLHFGAVNYEAHVYLNGVKLGWHKGGFTPFNFEIPDSLLQATGNRLVVKVDNKRKRDEIPTLNTDWWNYGGITRDVHLIEVPPQFIVDYSLQLKKGSTNELVGWIKFNEAVNHKVLVEIRELGLWQDVTVKGDSAAFVLKANGLQLWSPENPKLYSVVLRNGSETITDKIGFRTVEAKGSQILLNGKPVFLRGICIHEEIPREIRRAYSTQDAARLLQQAKDLNCNMVRLAHYPHNEHMTRMADSLGILVWSEIPVYWTIDFTNEAVLQKAKQQLHEMITRDRNRASIIIWSVGNETPVHAARTAFMTSLVHTARAFDSSRLISAALEVHRVQGVNVVDDPLGQVTDIVSVNEYLGWYGGGLSAACRNAKWDIRYNKPFFISETGAEALSGYHADSLTRWSEEFQEWFYREQMDMMRRMPPNFAGISPWILNDFRSPRRNNPWYQEGWNNKGVYDQQGRKKKAFYVLKAYYDEMEKKYR